MKNIKTYSEILNYLKNDKLVYEKAMSGDKISKLKRLKDAGDFKSILDTLNGDIDKVIDICKRIPYTNIEYSKNGNIITILYGNHIHTLLSTLKAKITQYTTDEIDKKIFGGSWKDLFLEVELDSSILNRIDIINGLPNFMKGIGLGKKIYKKLISDFGFISSFNGYKPSLDSSMVWDSIAKDSDIYTFTNDENIISFWNGLDFDIIIEKLKIFYKNNGIIQYDYDFLDKYQLSDLDLKKLHN